MKYRVRKATTDKILLFICMVYRFKKNSFEIEEGNTLSRLSNESHIKIT